MELHKLLREQEIVTTLSSIVLVPLVCTLKINGLTVTQKIVLTFPITLSKCMRILAMRLVCSTSIPLSCFFPLVNAE